MTLITEACTRWSILQLDQVENLGKPEGGVQGVLLTTPSMILGRVFAKNVTKKGSPQVNLRV